MNTGTKHLAARSSSMASNSRQQCINHLGTAFAIHSGAYCGVAGSLVLVLIFLHQPYRSPNPGLAAYDPPPRTVIKHHSAVLRAGEPRGACGLACRKSSRTGDNRSLDGAAGRAARRSIHAGAAAAAQHRPYTQAQSTEGATSRDGSADVSATADTMYSRIRRFGSADAVVLDLPDAAHS
jgi:hypothetical protein